MSSLKCGLTGLLLFFVASCGIFDPYIDRQRNPGVSDINNLYSGPSKPDAPVVCYNGLLTDDDKLQELATAECRKHGTGDYAEFQRKTYIDGKLLLPNQAFYKCVTGKEKNETSAGK